MISLAENRDFYQKSYQPQTLKQNCIYNLNIDFSVYLYWTEKYVTWTRNNPERRTQSNKILGVRRMFEQK